MEGKGQVIGKPAPLFTLFDHHEDVFDLSEKMKTSPQLLAFYPGGPFKPVCSGQFCDYRDHATEFQQFGVNIVGISSDKVLKQAAFAKNNDYPFLFLEDPDNKIAQEYGCGSAFMLGGTSRAVFILNSKGLILYRYVEPTILTRRGSKELLGILGDLKKNGLI